MNFLQTFGIQDFWNDSKMINTRYCAAAYFMQRLHILHRNNFIVAFQRKVL